MKHGWDVMYVTDISVTKSLLHTVFRMFKIYWCLAGWIYVSPMTQVIFHALYKQLKYSSYTSAEDSQTNHNNMQKNILRGVLIWLLTHTRKWTYSFIYYLIADVISFNQLNYCFLMSCEICKEYREY